MIATQIIWHKPEIVHEHYKFLKRVDQVDMYFAFYSFNGKTVKWWKCTETHLIHLATVQAHIIYKKAVRGQKKVSV